MACIFGLDGFSAGLFVSNGTGATARYGTGMAGSGGWELDLAVECVGL